MTPIFLIAGAPAAGKTTVSRALAGRFAKSIHIPLDTIRDMVVSGLTLPNPIWSQELIEQLAISRASVCAMALCYNQAGFAVAVDDFYDQNSHLLEYEALLAARQTHKILLYPSEQTALARNLDRYGPGRKTDHLAVGIRIVYDHLQSAVVDELTEQGWIVVDSTEQSVEQTVAEILKRTGANQ
ncbi:MAG: hypothetical protein R3E79_30940 [Caldilineaceae bacterium]